MTDDVDDEDLLLDESTVPKWRAFAGSITSAVVGGALAIPIAFGLFEATGWMGVEGPVPFLVLIGLGFALTELVGYRVADRVWLTPRERRRARDGEPRGYIGTAVEGLRSRLGSGGEGT